MRISLSALVVSVGAKLGDILGKRVGLACEAIDGSEIGPGRILGWTEAGNLLAAALAPCDLNTINIDAVATMRLREVSITDGRRGVTLSAEDAADHPLLQGWVEPTLGETFGQALRAGADLSNLAATGAKAWGASIIDDLGHQVGAEVAMRFGEDAYVSAYYGAEIGPALASTTRVLRHPAAFEVGANAADYSEPAVEGSPIANVQVEIAKAEAEAVGGFRQ